MHEIFDTSEYNITQGVQQLQINISTTFYLRFEQLVRPVQTINNHIDLEHPVHRRIFIYLHVLSRHLLPILYPALIGS